MVRSVRKAHAAEAALRARVAKALAQIEVLHQAKIAIAAEIPKDTGAHEDSLISIIVAGKPIAPAINPTNRAQAPAAFEKAVLKRAAENFRIL